MKKKFRFRLEVVQRVRAEKEQQLLRVLAQAQKKVIDAQNFRAELERETQAALIRREELGASVQAILAYQLESEFIQGHKQRAQNADLHVVRMKKQLEKVLREYLIAKRALRAIELLREKAYAEYKQEMKKREQKELEEIYVFHGSRNALNAEAESAGEVA